MNLKSLIKNTITLSLLFPIVYCIGSCSQTSRVEDVVYLMPKNFKGVVLVIFGQTDGRELKFENDKRVYEIPSDGVLRTKFNPNKGQHRHFFFTYDSSGKRDSLAYYTYVELKQKKPNEETIICYARESGVTTEEQSNKEVRFETLIVSDVKGLEQIAAQKGNVVRKVLHQFP